MRKLYVQLTIQIVLQIIQLITNIDSDVLELNKELILTIVNTTYITLVE